MFEAFVNNQMRDYSALSMEKLPGEVLRKGRGARIEIDSGFQVQANGDVIFKIYAPNAGKVEIGIERTRLALELRPDGVWQGVFPYDPHCDGSQMVDVIIDGLTVLYPYAPIGWHMGRQRNCVEIPDPGAEYRLLNRVPHGAIVSELYDSKITGRHQRCLIYTPPGYMKGSGTYPVLYLQHGATENETCWVYEGKVGLIMDNLLAEGKCEPFIIVMNNGEVRDPKNPDPRAMDDTFERMLLEDCIPYIEANYRVRTDKWSRAMAGLSMGSMQTSKIGLTHPELFCALGIFSGFMRFGGDHARQTDDHLEIIFDNKRFLKEYRLFFRSVGECDDNMMDAFEVDEGYVERSGIGKLPNYVCKKYPLRQHEWGAWYRAFHDFAPLLFHGWSGQETGN